MSYKKTTDTSLFLFPDWEEKPQQQDEPQRFDFSELFTRLARSEFRSRFHLRAGDKKYVADKGLDAIRLHARDFVASRLAPAEPHNDGKQTPMRGHPVFIAQHATGCCCRGCLSKWHHIQPGHVLSTDEQAYVVNVIMAWIEREMYGF